MSCRLLCPHCRTPLRRGYAASRDDGRVTHRRRDCPRCGARYVTREEIVAVKRRPVPARGVSRVEETIAPCP
jgi:transcriptional regulator NrdR family protein